MFIDRQADFGVKALTEWIRMHEWAFCIRQIYVRSWYPSNAWGGRGEQKSFWCKSITGGRSLFEHTGLPRSGDVWSIPYHTHKNKQDSEIITHQSSQMLLAIYLLPKRDFFLIWLLLANSRFFTKMSNSQMTLSRVGKVSSLMILCLFSHTFSSVNPPYDFVFEFWYPSFILSFLPSFLSFSSSSSLFFTPSLIYTQPPLMDHP